jgi:enoyl-CoA hydratase/carnithine racemase
MSDRVTVQMVDHVADVRLNRPDKLNALDLAMFEALVESGRALARDNHVRAVVLSGEGRSFCAGLDFASFMAMSGRGQTQPRNLLDRAPDSPANFAQEACYVWMALPVPVIAAVRGHTYGGGLQLALAADIRLATPDTQMSVMEVKWGLIPDMTGTQTLRHLVRLDVAKELTFTGRIISGAVAAELGLVTHVSEHPYEDAMDLARTIAGKSPHAIRSGKRLLDASRPGSLEEGLRLEESLQRTLLGSPNQVEAVQANFQKRLPDFRDPE